MQNRPSLLAHLEAWAVLTLIRISWSELDLTVQKWSGWSTEGVVDSREQGRNVFGLGIGVLICWRSRKRRGTITCLRLCSSERMLLREFALLCLIWGTEGLQRLLLELPLHMCPLQSKACPHLFLLNWTESSQIWLLWNNALFQLVLWCVSLSGSRLRAWKHLLKSGISSYKIISGIPF